MEQRSKEWFQARKGKLTGSNIGAALNMNPYKTPDDLIRQMVREYHGLESEFQGNVATEYGTLHEPLAVMDYEMISGNTVEDCGFFVSPLHEWLGASPDGLIGDDGLLEVKCPYGLRNKKGADLVFKTAKEQEHYYAQMQIEMVCGQRDWVDFFQWSENGSKTERVSWDELWLQEHVPQLEKFYQWYLSEINNPIHLEDKVKEINNLRADMLIKEYDRLKALIEDSEAQKKDMLAELVTLSGERNSLICGRKLTKGERVGSVAYAKVVKEHLKDLDLEPYRGKASEYWKLS
jgi:putative phage-type endonuclease